MNDFNSLRNNILKNEKMIKLIRSLEFNQAPLSHHLGLTSFDEKK